MTDIKEFKEVFEILKNEKNIKNLKQLADDMSMNYTYLSELNSGKKPISQDFLDKINGKYEHSFKLLEFTLPKYTERVEPVTLNFRMVPVINRYAYASYAESWDDPEYIESMNTLPTTELEDGNYLWFEVKGDSMSCETYPSIEEGDYILGRELYKHHWPHLQLRRIKVWIIVHRYKGIHIKEIVKQNNNIITCRSWNPLVKDFDFDLTEVNQLFYFKQLLKTKM